VSVRVSVQTLWLRVTGGVIREAKLDAPAAGTLASVVASALAGTNAHRLLSLSLSVSLFLSHASMTSLTTIVFFCVSLSLVYAWFVSLVRPGRPYGPDGVRQAVQAAVAEAGATPWLLALHTWLPTAL
jgi:hypothetical protein